MDWWLDHHHQLVSGRRRTGKAGAAYRTCPLPIAKYRQSRVKARKMLIPRVSLVRTFWPAYGVPVSVRLSRALSGSDIDKPAN